MPLGTFFEHRQSCLAFMLFVCRQQRKKKATHQNSLKIIIEGTIWKEWHNNKEGLTVAAFVMTAYISGLLKWLFFLLLSSIWNSIPKNCNRHQTPAQPAAKRFQQLHLQRKFFMMSTTLPNYKYYSFYFCNSITITTFSPSRRTTTWR